MRNLHLQEHLSANIFVCSLETCVMRTPIHNFDMTTTDIHVYNVCIKLVKLYNHFGYGEVHDQGKIMLYL